jgi:site-specific recombinase XerD
MSTSLHEICKDNLKKLNIRNIELINDNALTIDLSEYTHIYMFNPFSYDIMMLFMERIRETLLSKPRKMTIIYYNPKCEDVLLREGIFRKVKEVHHRSGYLFCVYVN